MCWEVKHSVQLVSRMNSVIVIKNNNNLKLITCYLFLLNLISQEICHNIQLLSHFILVSFYIPELVSTQ